MPLAMAFYQQNLGENFCDHDCEPVSTKYLSLNFTLLF